MKKPSPSLAPAESAAPVPPAAALAVHPIVVQPAKVEVRVEVPQPKNSLLDPATYAAALPGVLVAVVGFYVVHRLSRVRDREKRVTDMSRDIQDLAYKAASTAVEAWTASKGSKRATLVNEATQDFQALGAAVTRIQDAAQDIARRHSFMDAWQHKSWRLRFTKRKIDLSVELKDFRTLSLKDPFADPARGPDHSVIPDIHLELGNFVHALDQAITRCLP